MPRCLLFLDFDGVLHPTDSGPASYFSDLPRFEAVLREFPDVAVVIAPSWRHTRSPAGLRALFSPDLRARLIGVTPDIAPAPSASDVSSRHREVEAWLRAHTEPGTPWLAVEDVANLYDPGAPLIVTQGGFDDSDASALRAALADPIAFTWVTGVYLAPRKSWLAADSVMWKYRKSRAGFHAPKTQALSKRDVVAAPKRRR